MSDPLREGRGICEFSLENLAIYFFFGVPKILMISMSCQMELSPGNRGQSVISSTRMHPADHISIQQPQVVEFSMSSGARQYREQIQDTLFSFVSIILADPKSQIFSSQFARLISIFGGFRSRWQTLLIYIRLNVTDKQYRALNIWKAMSFLQTIGTVCLSCLCPLMRACRLVSMYSMTMCRTHSPSTTLKKQSFISMMLG